MAKVAETLSAVEDEDCALRWRGSAPRSSEIELTPATDGATCHCHNYWFQASESSRPLVSKSSQAPSANPGADLDHYSPRLHRCPVPDRLSLPWPGFSPLRLIGEAMAQTAADVAKPISLPDMGLGPANAPVTIMEYASMTCPHCADFNEDVFPKIKAEYIDSGKIRYMFREFPLDIKAAAGSMLSRCIAKDDAQEIFRRHRHAVPLAERLGGQEHHRDAGANRRAGRPGQEAGQTCLKDQSLLDKIAADQKYASDVLKVDSTPTFFINGEKIKGETSLEEFEKKINPLLKS